jgi:hypothetical protein
MYYRKKTVRLWVRSMGRGPDQETGSKPSPTHRIRLGSELGVRSYPQNPSLKLPKRKFPNHSTTRRLVNPMGKKFPGPEIFRATHNLSRGLRFVRAVGWSSPDFRKGIFYPFLGMRVRVGIRVWVRKPSLRTPPQSLLPSRILRGNRLKPPRFRG